MNTIAKILFKVSNLIRKVANRMTQNDKWRNILRDWKSANSKKDLRLDYPSLNSESVVFDLGGYEGQWASDIFAKYQSNVVIFEPYSKFYEKIRERFEKNDKVKIYDFGLSGKDQVLPISVIADATSTFKKGTDTVDIHLKNAESFLSKNQYEKIDLMKINIEGGEYDLLDHLIKVGVAGNIVNLQIQFHDFVPDAENRMSDIQHKLEQTHKLTFQYKFLWENWTLK